MKRFLPVLLVAGLLACPSLLSAATLFQAEILSDRSVRLVAVAGAPDNNLTNTTDIELTNFFTVNVTTIVNATLTDNTLTAGTNTVALSSAVAFGQGGFNDSIILTFAANPDFSTASNAFTPGTGVTLTWGEGTTPDGNMPALSASGNVQEAYNDPFTGIGGWQVTAVPEPTAAALAGLGLLALVFRRRRR